MAKNKEDVAVNCQFCSKRYVLTIDDCIKAWNNKPL
jgi:redox-regulated HSP33 family molecular chaperone